MSKKIQTSDTGKHYIVFGDEQRKYELIESKEDLPGRHHFVLQVENTPDEIFKELTVVTFEDAKFTNVFMIGLRACSIWVKNELNIIIGKDPDKNFDITTLEQDADIVKLHHLYKHITEVINTFGEYTVGYQNPIPSLDDTYVSQHWGISFTFPEAVDKEDAVAGIQKLLDENDGKIPEEWIRMGEPKHLRLAAPQN